MELPEEIQLTNPDIVWGYIFHEGQVYKEVSRDGDTVTCQLLSAKEYAQLYQFAHRILGTVPKGRLRKDTT